MRITGIEIANYRAFAGDSFRFRLEHGENLIVYGENGAGKSSLFHSLREFLECADHQLNITAHRNRDCLDEPPSVRVSTEAGPVTWSETERQQDTSDWRLMNVGKGFMDYKSLLRFYHGPKDRKGRMDLFEFVLSALLAHYRMTAGTNTFSEEWREIESHFGYDVRLNWRTRETVRQRIEKFSADFRTEVDRLAERATAMLRKFEPNAVIRFVTTSARYVEKPKQLERPTVTAQPERIITPGNSSTDVPPRTEPIANYEEFFNEARLSAMAVSLFFSALKECPVAGPRILVLDDVLIGLDMANRGKVINLAQDLFRDWQIIVLTYHKAWFEVLKARVKVGAWGEHKWHSLVLRQEKCPNTGLVTITYEESGTALETAELCLSRRDHRAAAVYARTALESVLQKHADRLRLTVRYKKDQRKLNSEHFLQPIERRFDYLADSSKRSEGKGLLAELRFCRRTVLNAFAHADEISVDEIAGEVEHAITIVRRFEAFLASLGKSDFAGISSEAEAPVPQLLMQARQHATDGNHIAACCSMKQATELFVTEYAESIGIPLPFRRAPSFRDLFRAVFPEDAMDTNERRAFRRLKPFLFGTYKRDEFNEARFDDAVRLILYTGYGKLLTLLHKHAAKSK